MPLLSRTGHGIRHNCTGHAPTDAQDGELARRGYAARLEKGDGYFYFRFGEAADWLDRTVGVRTINSLTLKQWGEEFQRLKALNQQIMGTVKRRRASRVGEAAAWEPGKANPK
jgi:hypothetical protein